MSLLLLYLGHLRSHRCASVAAGSWRLLLLVPCYLLLGLVAGICLPSRRWRRLQAFLGSVDSGALLVGVGLRLEAKIGGSLLLWLLLRRAGQCGVEQGAGSLLWCGCAHATLHLQSDGRKS